MAFGSTNALVRESPKTPLIENLSHRETNNWEQMKKVENKEFLVLGFFGCFVKKETVSYFLSKVSQKQERFFLYCITTAQIRRA